MLLQEKESRISNLRALFKLFFLIIFKSLLKYPYLNQYLQINTIYNFNLVRTVITVCVSVA